ncbi:hypothetical protein EZV73_24350 [Acidaminobacter sp. JC074]|uniref:RCC1 domain-containing protein n=1 Tax=Acidaminobacter sp. JC074 TaxID=2530199 RepID=UPI001F0F0454|nr:hypothetical protein [Acidaminobacter sp. JC074]MCH4890733.1 hypothetical protein [Acidaminobacter sp. JC074]
MEILLTVGLLVISGVGTFFYMQSQDDFDVFEDYKIIKKAYKAFRNENIGLTKGIENLEKYMPAGSEVKLERYDMSMDDKFLIVKKLPKGADPKKIVDQVGGNSVFKNNQLKLSFFTLGSGIEPVAKIKIQPMSNITTTTRLEYSYEESVAEDDKILEVEWENDEEYFDTEGVHTVRLKIMDKHYRWSEWTSVDIFVAEVKGVKSIEAGGGHLMVIHNNGDVYAYGENSFGQLGNCTNDNNVSLQKIVQIDKVESIAVGSNHTSILKADKKVFATGKNDFGQLGNGTRVNSKIPKLTWGLDNITQVACGHSFSAAVTVEGHVYTYGANENMCLGYNDLHFVDRPTRINDLENVKGIALGYDFALALGFDGNITAWGNNDKGQLGIGYKSKATEISLTQYKDAKMIAAGKNFSMVLSNQGRLYGCGTNRAHQLGFEGEAEVLFPREVPGLKDIVKVVCSNDFTLVLDQVGNMYSWGQYSPVDAEYALTPYLCDDLKYIKDIAVSANQGFALTEDDQIYEFGSKFSNIRKIEVFE